MGDGMKTAGGCSIAAGVLLALFGLFYDVSVESSYDTGRIVNMGLMQNQQVLIYIACALFIGGCVLFAGGAIIQTILAPGQAAAQSREAAKATTSDPAGHFLG